MFLTIYQNAVSISIMCIVCAASAMRCTQYPRAVERYVAARVRPVLCQLGTTAARCVAVYFKTINPDLTVSRLTTHIWVVPHR